LNGAHQTTSPEKHGTRIFGTVPVGSFHSEGHPSQRLGSLPLSLEAPQDMHGAHSAEAGI
jgi:hypothetical protein